MTADYASPLKVVWDEIRDCPWSCPGSEGRGRLCKGHAALLEMVEAYSLNTNTDLGHAYTERRRLRAAVGVEP